MERKHDIHISETARLFQAFELHILAPCIFIFLRRHSCHYAPLHTQTVVIRPLIFLSLRGSPGVVSNRAALTSWDSCSSHRGSPLISIDYFFSSLIRIPLAEDNISELRLRNNVSLSQSGRLCNYTSQQHAIQFFTRFSSVEVIPPSFPPFLPLPLLSFFILPSHIAVFFPAMLSDCKHSPKSNSSFINTSLLDCNYPKITQD